MARSSSDKIIDDDPNADAHAILRPPSGDRPSDVDVVDFLRAHHGVEPTDLEVLGGGFWSVAFGYRVGEDELVLRINDEPDGFRADELATQYDSPQLPVPEVLSIGEGLGRWIAISRRHRGVVLEDVGDDAADALGPTVVDLLAAIRTVPDRGIEVPMWRDWLLAGLTDRPGSRTSGWRARIAADAAADRTFRAADRQIRSLLDACPDRRELVHSDLLHSNVLVTSEADRVSAVFSWKCATWGDSLYDLAWCTFWGRWHPIIGSLELWDRVVPSLSTSEALDAGVRHHTYELQIGASHLGWYAALGDDVNLHWTARQVDELLERGPRR